MLEGIRRNHTKRKKTLWAVAAGLCVVALAISAGFFFKEYRDLKKNPATTAQATTDRVLEKVGKLYYLPKEMPTVAQIEDKSKLKDQSFFVGAENGDYLLVYADTKIALLYREKANKLVNVGPVNTDQNAQSEKSNGVAGENTKKP